MTTEFMREMAILVIAFTCLGVFVATAFAVVLDIFNLLKLAQDIRKKLHTVFVVEIIVISVGAFAGFLNPTKAVKKFENVADQNNKSKAALYLLQAEAAGGPGDRKNDESPDLNSIRKSVQAASKNLNESKVLWVDDNLEDQAYERQALEQLGVEFVLAKDTEQALDILKNQKFQVVITDFKRAEDEAAGYTLLKKIQNEKIETPVIIYSGSATPQFIAEAKSLGAYGETNRPQELFDMVVSAIKK